MYAPSKPGDQPSVEVSKEFMMSPNKLHLECSLDKELYYHGETISVNVHIQVNIERFKKGYFSKGQILPRLDHNYLDYIRKCYLHLFR